MLRHASDVAKTIHREADTAPEFDPERLAGFLTLYRIALTGAEGDHTRAAQLVNRWYQGYYQGKNARGKE